MWLLLSELISRLQQHWKERDTKDSPLASKDRDNSPSVTPKEKDNNNSTVTKDSPQPPKDQFRVAFTDDLPFQEYFALIDAHFESRKQQEALRDELEKSATQFRAIQKRLLVRYKDRNAVPLLNMDILLEGTYDEITKLSAKIQAMQKVTKIAACNLACATQLVQSQGYLILQTYLSARVDDTNTDQQQGWEESTDASLVQLLRTVLAASAQDMATLPGLTTLVDTKTLKQHIIMVTDRLAAGEKTAKAKPQRKAPS